MQKNTDATLKAAETAPAAPSKARVPVKPKQVADKVAAAKPVKSAKPQAKARGTSAKDGKRTEAVPVAKKPTTAKVAKAAPKSAAKPVKTKTAATKSVKPKVAGQKQAGQKKGAAKAAFPGMAARLLNPITPVTAYANFAGKMLGRLVGEKKTTPAQVIQDIANGPQGPQVIAAFDFDGTLIAGYSGNMLFQERRKRKDVSKDEMTESIGIMFKTMVKLVEANEMVTRAFARWEGKSQEQMEELSGHIYQNVIQDSVFPEMREILEAHRQAGHTLVVATSASRYQAEPAVTALGIPNLLCTELEVKDGMLTGKLAGETLFGAGKAAAIKKFVEDRGSSLEKTHFYADGSEEVGLMESVGHPHPVNPGSKLLDVAKSRKWPVLRLKSRGGAKPVDFIRNIAGMAAIGPILQTGLAVGALTRDKRSFANMVMPAWIKTQLQLAGVKLRVSGKKHLWERRPAVFIFNHRNFYDGMIAAALVKTDYAAIARKEMGDTAVGKLVQKIMPTVLIERGTGSKAEAAKALLPVVEAMNNDGYSVMLSPEGTRTVGNLNSVGPFKKGAFHMAMAAGVPIVPIVIRNALDIAGRSQGAMRAGTVDVAVLPPVPVDDWTQANLNERIAAVRQMFIDTLNDFPAPDDSE